MTKPRYMSKNALPPTIGVQMAQDVPGFTRYAGRQCIRWEVCHKDTGTVLAKGPWALEGRSGRYNPGKERMEREMEAIRREQQQR